MEFFIVNDVNPGVAIIGGIVTGLIALFISNKLTGE